MGADAVTTEQHLRKLRHGISRFEADVNHLERHVLALRQRLGVERLDEDQREMVDCWFGSLSALAIMRWVDHLVADSVLAIRHGANLALHTMARPTIDGVISAGYFVMVPHGWLLAEAAHVARWNPRARDDELWADLAASRPSGVEGMEELREAAVAVGWISNDVGQGEFERRLAGSQGPTTIAGRARKMRDLERGLADAMVGTLVRVEALLSDNFMHASNTVIRLYSRGLQPQFSEWDDLFSSTAAAPTKLREILESRLEGAGHRL